MTTNQIAFYDAQTRRMSALESQRHNVEDEDIRKRANEISSFGAETTAQHYERADAINSYSAQQNAAHYARADSIAAYSAEQTAQHYRRSDRIAEYNALINAYDADTRRLNTQGTLAHYERTDAESVRHNTAQEDIGYRNIGATYAQVGLGYSQLGELHRHNLVSEETQTLANMMENTYKQNYLHETERANKARETENLRHNQEMESQGRTDLQQDFIAIGYQGQNAETNRINAEINQQNAQTNAYNAGTARYDMYSHWLDSFANVYKLYTSGNKSSSTK